jgi:uncharacterized membrane protein YhdT
MHVVAWFMMAFLPPQGESNKLRTLYFEDCLVLLSFIFNLEEICLKLVIKGLLSKNDYACFLF